MYSKLGHHDDHEWEPLPWAGTFNKVLMFERVTGLTFPKLDKIGEEKAARAGSLGAAVKEGSVVVTTAAAPTTGMWHDSRPWRSH